MAVLHYPVEPKAYWTFDRHESMFEDSNQARYQPSPAWNREHDDNNLAHYWKLDENTTSTLKDFKGGINISTSASMVEADFSHGVLGNAFILKGMEHNWMWTWCWMIISLFLLG